VGGSVVLTVPVLDTAVGVRIPTTRLFGTIQIMAAVYYGSRGGSDTVVTTGITDWPLATLGVLLVVAAVVSHIKHLRVAVLVIRTEEVLRLTGWCRAVPVSPAVVFVWEPAGPHLLTVDVFLRWAAVRGGGGGRGVVTVTIAVVTHWPSGAVCQVLIVTAVIRQVEHLGVAVLVIGTKVVLRIQARLTVPVSPAVERVGVVTLAYSLTVDSLFRRSAVWLWSCSSEGRRTVNIPVRTRAVSALHVSRVHTEPVQNVKLEVVWTSLVGHTPSLALVELVAQLGVGLLDKIVGATNGAVREGVVTLPGVC